MKKIIIILMLTVIGMGGSLSHGDEFEPIDDGWYFVNWGEKTPYCVGSCDLSWDLYRKTYLGIHPTHDCVSAPLDCAFYEIFKNCAEGGNCGGMSMLALALFKHGGYLGYCSPASFYTGTKSPDRDDLHQAINIMQARQFSVSGIENFLDVIDAGNLNNADVAFFACKTALNSGDYPVLSIAKDSWGDAAHTVIPYKLDESPSGYSAGTKIMYIWDPNLPYDDNAANYSNASTTNHLVITSPTGWSYSSYSGSGGGWCFCIPMSKIMEKSRQPMALDMLNEALTLVFVSGTGAAVSQISDDEGHRLYKTDADAHTSRSDLETDPAKRLKGVGRWPWYGQAKMLRSDVGKIGTPALGKVQPAKKHEQPGELYFMRRSVGNPSDLHFTFSGKKYEATISLAGNMIKINSESATRTKDIIKLSRMATAAQSLEIQTLGAQRKFNVKQVRTGATGKEWRSIDVKELNVTRSTPVTINVLGDMEAVAVSSLDKQVSFNMTLQQRFKGEVSTMAVDRLSTTPGKVLRLAPGNWETLDKTKLEKIEVKKEVIQQMEKMKLRK